MRLFVIRHAQPWLDPAVPPEQWRLAPEGVAATRELVRRWSWHGVAAIHHSPQPKTEATGRVMADVLHVPLLAADDLAELAMDAGFLGDEAFADRVGAFLEGGRDPAFEDYDRAQQRITACVTRLMVGAAGRDLAIVSHGRIITVLFSALTGERLGRKEWQSIAIPDLSLVDFGAGRVTAGFFAGRGIRHPGSLGSRPPQAFP